MWILTGTSKCFPKTAGNLATRLLLSSTTEYSSMNLVTVHATCPSARSTYSSHNADQVYAPAVLPPKSTVHNEGTAQQQKGIIWPTA